MIFGQYDCVRFVAEALKVGWDKDYLKELQYHDRRSAVRRLRAAGGLREATIEVLGPEISITALGTGDVAWVEPPFGPKAIGLIMPSYIALKGKRTIHRLRMELAGSGWKVN